MGQLVFKSYFGGFILSFLDFCMLTLLHFYWYKHCHDAADRVSLIPLSCSVINYLHYNVESKWGNSGAPIWLLQLTVNYYRQSQLLHWYQECKAHPPQRGGNADFPFFPSSRSTTLWGPAFWRQGKMKENHYFPLQAGFCHVYDVPWTVIPRACQDSEQHSSLKVFKCAGNGGTKTLCLVLLMEEVFALG